MSGFDVLRSRVEDAADTLVSTEAERHRQNEALIGLLGQLECKFDAQQQELEYCRARIRPLEETNEELARLMDRLLAMIDQGFGEASVAPLRDAAAHAARLLERDLGSPAPDTGEETNAAFGLEEVGFEDVGDEALAVEAASDDGAYFENVGEAELMAETEIEAEGDTDLPAVVVGAHRAAARQAGDEIDVIAEAMDAIGGDAQASEIDSMDSLVERLAVETSGPDGGEAGPFDIRSLLHRVEAAAGDIYAGTEAVGDIDREEPRHSAVA